MSRTHIAHVLQGFKWMRVPLASYGTLSSIADVRYLSPGIGRLGKKSGSLEQLAASTFHLSNNFFAFVLLVNKSKKLFTERPEARSQLRGRAGFLAQLLHPRGQFLENEIRFSKGFRPDS